MRNNRVQLDRNAATWLLMPLHSVTFYLRRLQSAVAGFIFLAIVLFTSFTLYSCQGQPQPQQRLTGKTIEEVLKENTPHLMSIPGVVGTAIGECNNNPCIKVLVDKKTAILQQQIPSMLETWQVEIVESGAIKPL